MYTEHTMSLLAAVTIALLSGGPEITKVPVRQITHGPRHHWFGYYDKLQFDPIDRHVLAMEVDFEHRSPRPDDVIKVGMVDLKDNDRWIELGQSVAWNWQQGCMLQWVPGSGTEILWNDRESDQFVCRVLDIRTKRIRTIGHPIYSVSPDGKTAVSADFRRIQDVRPGYGYAGPRDPHADDLAPEDSGVFHIDLKTGSWKLIISLADVARLGTIPEAKPGIKHYFNHLLFNPDGSRLIVLHRWRYPDGSRRTRMITARPDGSDLRIVVPNGYASHFIWRDRTHILVQSKNWLGHAGWGNFLFEDKQGAVPELIGRGVLDAGGHISYLPGNEWILNDTYPRGEYRMQTPHLYHVETGRRIDLGHFPSPKVYSGEWRVDTHPRFSRSGRLVCIDAPHEAEGRQLHLLDISAILPRAAPNTTDADVSDGWRITRQQDGWRLLKSGKPFTIKGAVGWNRFEVLRACGGNAVRTGAKKRTLDAALREGLAVMVNLPVHGERRRMNWGNAEQVVEQKRKVLAIVEELKDHPAVMFWSIGNELDYIPGSRSHHPRLWERLNDLALAIKRIDSRHPVLTVVGTGRFEKKVQQIARVCTDLDLLGINCYGDIDAVTQLARRYWPKPYAITEWGPTGHWQVPKTKWSAPLEETSSEKARVIKQRYESAILTDPGHCLGSFVFYWSEKQETTHTWYGLFRGGLRTESIDVMQYLWTGTWPANRSPAIQRIAIDGFSDPRSITLNAGAAYRAEAKATDPDSDPLTFAWEIRPEVKIPPGSYAGSLEKKAIPIKGLIRDATIRRVEFTAPQRAGTYRLFVTILDGQGHAAYGNVPFLATR